MLKTKPALRFIPTLTEVVRPGVAPLPAPINPEYLVEQVLQAVRPRLEQQLRAALHALVEEQLRKASPQWQLDVENAVNAAVAQAVAQRMPPKV
jgi:hypothetical protein